MSLFTRSALAAGLLTALSQAQAAELQLTLQLPKQDVAEYHKPYVAAWIEDSNNHTVSHLALWYDTRKANGGGEKWLKDLRQWWRRGGRALQLPVDGVSGATQGPGEHRLTFSAGGPVLADLPAGDYRLRVEAAREVGGRELLEIPFHWPAPQSFSATAAGNNELGSVTLSIQP